MYNKTILAGNLTRDIELRYTQSGVGIANTAIATSRKYTVSGEKKEDVCFVDITFFGKISEIANQYLRKGSKILIEGHLNFDQWTDKDGQKRSKHSVVVETMQMLDSKQDSQQGTQQGYAPQQKQAPVYEYQNSQGQQTPPPQRQAEVPPAIDIPDSDIPF